MVERATEMLQCLVFEQFVSRDKLHNHVSIVYHAGILCSDETSQNRDLVRRSHGYRVFTSDRIMAPTALAFIDLIFCHAFRQFFHRL